MNQSKAMWVAGAVLTGVIATVFWAYSADASHADPSVETVLPYEGVVSIGRAGDQWTVVFDAPPWELKVISDPQQIVCGANYGNPCETTETFTWASDCVYTQVDWNGGLYNSSDPYVCRIKPPLDPPKPQDIPFSETTPPTCESPFTVTLTGVYSHTLVDGVWAQDTEPSMLTSSKAPADVAGCESDAPPTLASTGFEPWHLWLIPIAPLIAALGFMLHRFARTWESNHRPRHLKEGKR